MLEYIKCDVLQLMLISNYLVNSFSKRNHTVTLASVLEDNKLCF